MKIKILIYFQIEIHISLLFLDIFIYIPEVIITPELKREIITESYQNLNDCKKYKINKLLDTLYEGYYNYELAELYDHIYYN